jgi:hypothetical protein
MRSFAPDDIASSVLRSIEPASHVSNDPRREFQF